MSGTAPDPNADLEATYRQLLQQTVPPPAVQLPQGPSPSSHEGRGWLSLLGEALGGGQQYGTTAERESGGIRALGALGQRMLAASDYSYQPHTLGSIIGQGMGAAGESLAGTQQVSAAQQGALLDYQKQQQDMQLARIKEAVPILTQLRELQKQKALAGLGSPLGGNTPGTTPGTSIGAAGPYGPGTAPINAAGDSATRKAGEGGPPAPGTPGAAVAQQVHDFWIGKGYSEEQVAGIMAGGPGSESNFDPTAGGDKVNGVATSYGLYQHHAERLDNMRKYFGLSGSQMPSADQQNQYAYWEITDGPLKNVGAALKAAKTPAEAAAIWTGQFGVPADKSEVGRRALGAGRFSGLYTPKTPPDSNAQAAASAVPGGGAPLTPPGAAQPSPTGPIAEATRAAEVGPLPLPATAGKATPLPAGNLQTTGKPPGVASNAEAIQAGINLAQATPVVPGTGLAAGPPGIGQPATLASAVPGSGAGFAPTAAPPAAPAPQAPTQAQQPPPAEPVVTTGAIPRSTPDAVPDTFEEYQAQHPIVPSDEDRRSFSTDPDAAQLSVLQRQAQIAKYAMDVARTQGDAAGLAKASEAYNTILASENTLRENAGKAGADRRAAFMKDQGANQFNAWKAAQDEKQKRITQQQQNDAALKLEQERGQQTRLTNKESVFNQANQKGLETAQAEQANARDIVTQAEGFQTLSDNVGQPGWLQTTKFPGDERTIAERLQQSGIKLDDTAGVQLLRGGITNLVKTLRAGMPMGSLSDRDLSFVERMGPTEWMDQDTRTAAVSYIVQAYRAKMRFASDVQKEMSRGKNYGDAVDAADAKQKPFVPAVPADLTAHWRDPDPTWVQRRTQWAQENDVRPGTLYHMSDGSIAVMRDPNRKLKTEQR